MKEIENNQLYESKGGNGTVRCLYRCKVSKFKRTKEGKQSATAIVWNRCRLKHNQNKNCSWPECNEKTCHVPKFKIIKTKKIKKVV